MIEDLSLLPDAERLRRIMTLASARIKPRGSSSIEVIDGVWMNVHVNNTGCVELRIRRRNREDALAIQERLKDAGYDAEFRELKDGFEVYINQDELRKHPGGLVVKVCGGVLRKMLDETLNEGKTKKTQKTTKATASLNCPPPKGPRA